MSGALQPPALADLLDSEGRRASPAYLEYLRAVGSAGNQAITAQQLATAANTAATTAAGHANTALAQVTALLASPPVWGIGDYRPSAKTTLDPTVWLECNGSPVSQATYLDLYAMISPSTGGSGGTFFLPTIPPMYDPSHPEPGGPPFLRWYVRAL